MVDAASTVSMKILLNLLLFVLKNVAHQFKYTIHCSTSVDVGRRRKEFISSLMICQRFDRVSVVG